MRLNLLHLHDRTRNLRARKAECKPSLETTWGIGALTVQTSRLRNLLICFAQVATFALLAPSAYPAPIPIGSDSSDDLLFNLDLTNESTAYDTVTLTYFLDPPDATAGGGSGSGKTVEVTADVFSGLNGSESLLTTLEITISGGGAIPDHTTLAWLA